MYVFILLFLGVGVGWVEAWLVLKSSVCGFRCKTTIEAIHGLMSQVIKDRLFNQVHCKPSPTS